MLKPGSKYMRFVFLVWLLLILAPLGVHAANLPEFTDLIEQNSSSVVKITTVIHAQSRNQLRMRPPQPFPNQQEIPEIFRELFEQHNAPERDYGSLGSGFIISEDGYILTNYHVINDADEITVRMIDQREYKAQLVGSDRRSDLALLKIDAQDLPKVKFAKADTLKVGQWVLAIGSPFGLDYSASAGIVSAMGRFIYSNNSQYVPFIQTDVAINPGNSGGPLFNLDGEVVGINSQIYTRSGGSNGLSFSIPAEVALDVVAQLKDKGLVERGWLGVVITDVDRDLAISFGLDKPIGALVNDVEAGSPADEAGIKPSDIITAFNGTEVSESSVLPQLVGRVAPGTEIEVTVMRKGERENFTVTLGEREPPASVATGDHPRKQEATNADRLGLRVEALNARQRERRELDGGVLVRQVDPGSAAAKTGLRPGDVIVQLGYEEIAGLKSYRQQLKELPENKLLPIRFYRQGQPLIRTIQITTE